MLVLPAACESSNDTNTYGLGVVVEDSAGVTIVTNDPPAPDSRLPWQFSVQPSLSIGSVDSVEADQLFRVVDATRLPDGRIVIANTGSNELKVFNADGSHAGTWGRRGEGPGEFTSFSPTAVAPWPGDSIAAPNPWGTRLSLFDRDGNHGRDVPLDASLLNVVDLLPGGMIFTSGSGGMHQEMTGPSGLVRSRADWAVLAADGTLHASLGVFPGSEYWPIVGEDGTIAGGRPHPFGRGTLGAVWGDLVAIGVQDSYEIKAFAAYGTLVRIVRRTGNLEQPTRADQDAYFAERFADWPDFLNEVKDMPLVDSYPAFGEILSDLAGNLWVREYSASGAGDAVWAVFDPEGRIRGLVETPSGLEVFEIGEDYVLGLVEDELGVEYVQMYDLHTG